MKNIIILLFVVLCAKLDAQYIPISNQMFSNAASLKQQAGSPGVAVQVNGISSYNDGLGGTFVWIDTATAADDGLNTFQVTGVSVGRWVRLANTNTIKKTAVFSGVTLQTNYTISHNLGYVPAMIIIQPKSLGAAALSYVSAITSTSFTVTFLTVPIVGTNNITFDYIIIKH